MNRHNSQTYDSLKAESPSLKETCVSRDDYLTCMAQREVAHDLFREAEYYDIAPPQHILSSLELFPLNEQLALKKEYLDRLDQKAQLAVRGSVSRLNQQKASWDDLRERTGRKAAKQAELSGNDPEQARAGAVAELKQPSFAAIDTSLLSDQRLLSEATEKQQSQMKAVDRANKKTSGSYKTPSPSFKDPVDKQAYENLMSDLRSGAENYYYHGCSLFGFGAKDDGRCKEMYVRQQVSSDLSREPLKARMSEARASVLSSNERNAAKKEGLVALEKQRAMSFQAAENRRNRKEERRKAMIPGAKGTEFPKCPSIESNKKGGGTPPSCDIS